MGEEEKSDIFVLGQGCEVKFYKNILYVLTLVNGKKRKEVMNRTLESILKYSSMIKSLYYREKWYYKYDVTKINDQIYSNHFHTSSYYWT